MQRTLFLFLLFSMLATGPASAQQTGPMVKSYGPAYTVPSESFNLDPDQQYKVVMDIGSGSEDPDQLNRRIESAARFLNMHAQNGIKPENLKLAVVLHGTGARAALNEQAHQQHFQGPNPNQKLLEELGLAGVDIYICGQTAGYYGYLAEDLLPEVTMAVSAMTAHVRLQQEGYRAILF